MVDAQVVGRRQQQAACRMIPAGQRFQPDDAEQHAIAVLAAGISTYLCDDAAVRSLMRAGLVMGGRLTPKAELLRKAAILQNLAA